jgi:hypothetical protein
MYPSQHSLDLVAFDFSSVTAAELRFEFENDSLTMLLDSEREIPAFQELGRYKAYANYASSEQATQDVNIKAYGLGCPTRPIPMLSLAVYNDLYTIDAFEFLGIKRLPYANDVGEIIVPSDEVGVRSSILFERLFDRSPNGVDVDGFRAVATAAAAASPEVSELLKCVDFTVLHAFDCSDDDWFRENASEWLSRDNGGRAMRAFLADYPLLASVACADSDLFEIAQTAETPEEGYQLILDRIQAVGFPADPNHDMHVGPMSANLLDRIKGLRFTVHDNSYDDDSIHDVHDAMEFARRLPVAAFPDNVGRFERMNKWREVIAGLALDQRDFSEEEICADGSGLGIAFTDSEMAIVLAEQCERLFDVEPPKKHMHGIDILGCYGMMLAGHEDWVHEWYENEANAFRDEPDISASFPELKAELVSKGFNAVFRDAMNYAALFVSKLPPA